MGRGGGSTRIGFGFGWDGEVEGTLCVLDRALPPCGVFDPSAFRNSDGRSLDRIGGHVAPVVYPFTYECFKRVDLYIMKAAGGL